MHKIQPLELAIYGGINDSLPKYPVVNTRRLLSIATRTWEGQKVRRSLHIQVNERLQRECNDGFETTVGPLGPQDPFFSAIYYDNCAQFHPRVSYDLPICELFLTVAINKTHLMRSFQPCRFFKSPQTIMTLIKPGILLENLVSYTLQCGNMIAISSFPKNFICNRL